MSEDSKVCMLEMQVKLDKVCNGIDVMQDKQEEMSQDIAKIKEAVYNPESRVFTPDSENLNLGNTHLQG